MLILFPTRVLLQAFALLFVPGIELDDIERERKEFVLAFHVAAALGAPAVIVEVDVGLVRLAGRLLALDPWT